MEHIKKTSRYYLASASIRIWSRALDIIIFFTLNIVLDILLILIINHNLNIVSSYNYLLIFILLAIIAIGYFIIVPFYFNGQTLAMKLCHIRTMVLSQKNTFWHYVLKELLATIVMCVIALFVGIACLFIPQDQLPIFFNEILAGFKVGKEYHFGTLVVIVSIFLTFYFICSLVIFANVWYRSKHRCWVDYFSNTAIVYLKLKGTKIDTSLLKNKKATLPGVVDSDILEELKKI